MSNEGKKNKNKNDKKDIDDLSIKCKVVLIGKSTVGKTSIILRYTSKNSEKHLYQHKEQISSQKMYIFPSIKKQ